VREQVDNQMELTILVAYQLSSSWKKRSLEESELTSIPES
jgi:hypothetical protein